MRLEGNRDELSMGGGWVNNSSACGGGCGGGELKSAVS